MKNWWLELYTIPALKKLFRNSILALFAASALALLVPGLGFDWFGMINFYMIFGLSSDFRKSLGGNIEFHKSHMPYKEVRRAFLIDYAIRVGSTFIMCSLNLILVQYLKGQFDLEVINFYIMAYLIGVAMTFNFKGIAAGKERVYKIFGSHMNRFQRFVVTMLLGIIGATLFFIGLFLKFKQGNIMLVLAVGYFLGIFLFYFRALFHQAKKEGTVRAHFKFSFVGLGLTSSVYALFLILTLPYVEVASIPVSLRGGAYMAAGSFAPELTIQSAKAFIKEFNDYESVAFIFSRSPALEYYPIAEVFHKPNALDFKIYLRYSKHPTRDNLIYILETQKKTEKFTQLMARNEQEIVTRWPKTEKFPEHLVSHRTPVLEKRLPASSP